jgi:hypothetical protein
MCKVDRRSPYMALDVDRWKRCPVYCKILKAEEGEGYVLWKLDANARPLLPWGIRIMASRVQSMPRVPRVANAATATGLASATDVWLRILLCVPQGDREISRATAISWHQPQSRLLPNGLVGGWVGCLVLTSYAFPGLVSLWGPVSATSCTPLSPS